MIIFRLQNYQIPILQQILRKELNLKASILGLNGPKSPQDQIENSVLHRTAILYELWHCLINLAAVKTQCNKNIMILIYAFENGFTRNFSMFRVINATILCN